MYRYIMTAAMILIIGSTAWGEKICICQNNGSLTKGTDWQYNSNDDLIEILESHQNDVFEFEVITISSGNCASNCEECFTCTENSIDAIVSLLTETTSGQFIRVQVGDATSTGAIDVARIAIEPSSPNEDNVETEIKGVNISGDFLSTAAMTVDKVTGNVDVGNDLLNAITVNENLTAKIDIAGSLTKAITINGRMDATTAAPGIVIGGSLGEGGQIQVMQAATDASGTEKEILAFSIGATPTTYVIEATTRVEFCGYTDACFANCPGSNCLDGIFSGGDRADNGFEFDIIVKAGTSATEPAAGIVVKNGSLPDDTYDLRLFSTDASKDFDLSALSEEQAADARMRNLNVEGDVLFVDDSAPAIDMPNANFNSIFIEGKLDDTIEVNHIGVLGFGSLGADFCVPRGIQASGTGANLLFEGGDYHLEDLSASPDFDDAGVKKTVFKADISSENENIVDGIYDISSVSDFKVRLEGNPGTSSSNDVDYEILGVCDQLGGTGTTEVIDLVDSVRANEPPRAYSPAKFFYSHAAGTEGFTRKYNHSNSAPLVLFYHENAIGESILTDGLTKDLYACVSGGISDLDGDGLVNLNDFANFVALTWLAQWTWDADDDELESTGTQDLQDVLRTDLNFDGVTNLVDFATFAAQFGIPSGGVPADCAPPAPISGSDEGDTENDPDFELVDSVATFVTEGVSAGNLFKILDADGEVVEEHKVTARTETVLTLSGDPGDSASADVIYEVHDINIDDLEDFVDVDLRDEISGDPAWSADIDAICDVLATYSGSSGDQLATNLQDINFRPTNDDDSISVEKNPMFGVVFGFGGKYADVDGDTLKVSTVTGPTHGWLCCGLADQETGSLLSITYHPDEDYTGPDSFTWKVKELGTTELYESNPHATVSITVTD